MDKLTLDTNILRDWAWCEGKSTEARYGNSEAKRQELRCLFARLRALRDNMVCELGVTTQLYTDYGDHRRSDSSLPKHIQEMIGPYVSIATPAISTFPLVFPVVFVDENEIAQIFQDVFPHSNQSHKNYSKNRKDTLQLYAHRVAGRDYFVTSDRAILDSRPLLAQNRGIQVKPLGEYVSEKECQ